MRASFQASCGRAAMAALLTALAEALLACAWPRPAFAATVTGWPQARSDIPADPSTLFGVLPNGMRYAIKKNDSPKGAVAMRLAIEAGSLNENDAQQGLAHFLEHMAFRGSRHVPESQVWPGLQRLGMAVGADADASTAFTQTLYQFNLPRNDAETVDTGLMRLREIASELTLAQSAMDDERGVILSERRLRNTPGYASTKAALREMFPGALAMTRWPIGQKEVVEHAPVSLIRDFYNAYYRPERATLIVVGDVDPKVLQAKITKRFADWAGVGPAGRDPAQGLPGVRDPQAALFVRSGAPSYLALTWVTSEEADTIAREKANLVARIGMMILANRLQEAANGPDRLFASAQPVFQHMFHTSYVRSLMLGIKPKDWRLAVQASTTAVRSMARYGVSADEMNRAVNDFRAYLQNVVARANTLRSPALADALAENVDEGGVYANPAEMLSIAEETFKTLTPEKVSAAFRVNTRGRGPLLFLSSPEPINGGQAALEQTMAAAEKASLARQMATARVAWPYTSFGSPGAVVAQKTIPDLQTTFVRFANGVRLTVKPTSFAAGEIRVAIKIGDGRAGLPKDRSSPTWAVKHGFVFGGLKKIGVDALQRALAGKLYRAVATYSEDGLMLLGRTRPADLLTQVQVLAAYVAAPGWRASGVDRARTLKADQIVQANGSPTGVLLRNLKVLLRNGDKRWAPPSLAQVEALRPQDLKQLLARQLASAPIEVTLVGDVKVDDAVRAVAATFGALPQRAKREQPAPEALAVRFPTGSPTPVELHHKGRPDQGFAAAAWPTMDAYHVKSVQALRIISSVFGTRLMDQLRVKAGVTYSPVSLIRNSKIFPGFGEFLAGAELPPAEMPLFFKTSDAIASDLRAHAISADELERARKPLVEEIIANQQKNAYWTLALSGAQTDARRLALIRDAVPDLQRVTAQDVQQVAQTYLTPSKTWRLEITPQPAAPAAH